MAGMKTFSAVLCAILVVVGVFSTLYLQQRSQAIGAKSKNETEKSEKLSWIFSSNKSKYETPTSALRPKAPEMSVTQAVTIKTPDGDLTIPKGAHVRVIETVKFGTVAVNYQGYTAPVPAETLVAISR